MEARNRASWLNWLRRWRLIRWWLRLVVPPVLLPFEILQFSLRKIRRWLKQTALAPTEAYVHRFQHLVDFILAEVENRQILHPSAILPLGRLSGLRITEVSTGGEKLVAAQQSSQARKMSLAQRKMSTSIAPLDLAFGLDGPREEGEEKVDEEDAKRVLQQFCERHDAVLAFHYRDDQTNELKICQIFDANGRHPRNVAIPFEGHHEEEAMTESREDAAKGEDSGLSLEEEEGNQQEDRRERLRAKTGELQKKDACCSPVRHLATGQFGARRHTFSSRPSRLSASTRTLPSTPRFVAPGSRLYASNSMNALKTGEAMAKGAAVQRKISMQTIGHGGSDSEEEKEEEGEWRGQWQSRSKMGNRVQRKWSARK